MKKYSKIQKGNLTQKKQNMRTLILLTAFCLCISGCGKTSEKKEEGSICQDYAHSAYMEDGMLYQDYTAHLVKYLDYETGKCYPFCVRPNCRHDSEDCVAYALCEQVQFMGRLGDQWYYFSGDTEETLHVCDLDGGNDRVIGTYPYKEGCFMGSAYGNVLFQDGSCFVAMGVDNFEEDPDDPMAGYGVSVTSNIYQYHLDTGEREALCPEKTMRLPSYMVFGIYDNKLVYSELLDDVSTQKTFRMMDLETKEISEPDLSAYWLDGYMNENLLVYNEPDGEETRLVEFDLETGEKTVIFEDGYASDILWGPELKTFVVFDSSEKGENHRVYQYTDGGECVVLYEKEIFSPYALGGGLVTGQDSDWDRAMIKKEDFLAGKTNWTKIVEAGNLKKNDF